MVHGKPDASSFGVLSTKRKPSPIYPRECAVSHPLHARHAKLIHGSCATPSHDRGGSDGSLGTEGRNSSLSQLIGQTPTELEPDVLFYQWQGGSRFSLGCLGLTALSGLPVWPSSALPPAWRARDRVRHYVSECRVQHLSTLPTPTIPTNGLKKRFVSSRSVSYGVLFFSFRLSRLKDIPKDSQRIPKCSTTQTHRGNVALAVRNILHAA